MSCLSRKVFSQFLVVILTFHKKINILRLLALKHSERSAEDAQGHGGKKIEKKKKKTCKLYRVFPALLLLLSFG